MFANILFSQMVLTDWSMVVPTSVYGWVIWLIREFFFLYIFQIFSTVWQWTTTFLQTKHDILIYKMYVTCDNKFPKGLQKDLLGLTQGASGNARMY